MPDTDWTAMLEEEVNLSLLKSEVARLSIDFYAHARKVDEYILKIMEFMSEEVGARKEREKNLSERTASLEMTWTKVMAMAAMIGAFTSLPSIIHLIHP
jgi:hypothetical protein